MHDDADALLTIVGDQVTAMLDAAKTFHDSPREGVENLDLGRPLLHDLKSLASTLNALAGGLTALADQVERRLTRWPVRRNASTLRHGRTVRAAPRRASMMRHGR